MPDFGKGVIVGAGLAGLSAAYWFREHNPDTPLVVLEKEDRPLRWLERKGLGLINVGDASGPGEPLAERYPHGLPELGRLMKAWPGAANLDWLKSIGFRPVMDTGLMTASLKATELRETWKSILKERNVEILGGYAVEAISLQPDGSFRLWSREGDPLEASGVLLATGGERNHGMTLARELGHGSVPVEPGFLRLRLASSKLGSVLGPVEREVRIKCLKSGKETSGSMSLSARGLEGLAVSRLSAQVASTWRQLGHRFKVEVDWLPDLSPGRLWKEMLERAGQGGRKPTGGVPLYGFNSRQWGYFLKLAKVDAESPWQKIKPKKLQSLAQQLKRCPLIISGSGLPNDERSWSGGVHRESVDWVTGKSRSMNGIWFAGEMLDFLGMPGGAHMNAVWASAYQAGCSMGLELGVRPSV